MVESKKTLFNHRKTMITLITLITLPLSSVILGGLNLEHLLGRNLREDGSLPNYFLKVHEGEGRGEGADYRENLMVYLIQGKWLD